MTQQITAELALPPGSLITKRWSDGSGDGEPSNPGVDRFARQQTLVPQTRLQDIQATVIGLGAIGRQVALQLAAIGCRKVQLFDFDQVDHTNRTTQGYAYREVGIAKVWAARTQMLAIEPEMRVEVVEDRYRAKYPVGDAVFCCVDSISARAAIWRSVEPRCQFLGRWPDVGRDDPRLGRGRRRPDATGIRQRCSPNPKPSREGAPRGAPSTPPASQQA